MATKKSNSYLNSVFFTMLFIAIVGVLGGFGYCIYIHQYVVAAGILIAGGLAVPCALKILDKITS